MSTAWAGAQRHLFADAAWDPRPRTATASRTRDFNNRNILAAESEFFC